jgi:hypothetical protein
MTGLLSVGSQETVSLVKEAPSVDNGEASELVYLLRIVNRENGISV